MKRFAALLALALTVTLPVAASAKKSPPTLAPMTTATMPACPAGDPVVWINTSSHVYHAQGTRYFGKTAHGMYACKSKADAEAKPAGMRSKSTMSSASPDPAMPATGKKHHKKGAATTGMPMASPTP